MNALLRLSILAVLIVASVAVSPSGQVLAMSGGKLWQELNEIQQAQGKEAADARYYELSTEEQQSVLAFMTNVTIEAETEVSPTMSDSGFAVNGCYSVYNVVAIYTPFGDVSGRYYQSMDWCSNGSTSYNRYCNTWAGDTGWGFWFENHITYCQLNGSGYWFNFFSQGRFCAGVGFCQVTKTPWIRQTGGANGEYSWNWGG